MDSLVLCPCGHTMASHAGDGCRGDRFRRCACARARLGALDAAIDAHRLKSASAEPQLAAE